MVSADNSGPTLPMYILRVWLMLRRREGGREGRGGRKGGRERGKLGMEWTISEKDNEKKRKQDNKNLN